MASTACLVINQSGGDWVMRVVPTVDKQEYKPRTAKGATVLAKVAELGF
jgi:hypothetical protein